VKFDQHSFNPPTLQSWWSPFYPLLLSFTLDSTYNWGCEVFICLCWLTTGIFLCVWRFSSKERSATEGVPLRDLWETDSLWTGYKLVCVQWDKTPMHTRSYMKQLYYLLRGSKGQQNPRMHGESASPWLRKVAWRGWSLICVCSTWTWLRDPNK
jgi:hypothetical protein